MNALTETDKKEFYQEGLGKWYSWDSPIGLSVAMISATLSLAGLVGTILVGVHYLKSAF
ncbi:hypothetical protein LPTSP3_g14630 [Leptospira kobayashii]|uniref:Uncharacterized protein n=1 Tax=Leptospira kobayashii TaxID=1917830 RepID=A0ABM7UIG2_9LEPT|nr:hypothetical protein [Leptospira kobayashii]BDA78533.1 hypothetical protein LPTSP3_g14630 [Leptospira kobayashii]